MSLYLFLIVFSVGITLLGAVLILFLEDAREEHDEEVAVQTHLAEQYQAIEAARREAERAPLRRSRWT